MKFFNKSNISVVYTLISIKLLVFVSSLSNLFLGITFLGI